MDISGFKKRITVCEEVISIDEMGFEQSNLINYIDLWAYINNLKGSEFWEAKQVGYENTLEITVRYNPKLNKINTKTFFIKYEDRLFNIVFIDNVKYENKYIKFKVIERG